MRILVTNDDGVYSPGIAALAQVAARFGEVRVVAPAVAKVLELLLAIPALGLVNVNFPAKSPRGTVWTRQSLRHYDGRVVPAQDPMGRTHCWFTVVPVEATEEGTDRWAIEQGYVSMMPLRLDLTDHDALTRVEKLEAWKRLKFA